jgi:hypothetical protein
LRSNSGKHEDADSGLNRHITESVKGYSGAAVAAVSIAVIYFLLLFPLLGGVQLVGSATNP